MNNTIREIETLPAGIVRTSVVCPGEMADLVRSYDWGSTELGSIENWSEALIGVVNLALSSPDPVALQLGTRLLLIYNDAYRTILNEAHPAALGAQMEVVWNYLWPQIGWQLQAVMSEGKVVAGDQVTVPAKRNGKSEDHYWNYSFNPNLQRQEGDRRLQHLPGCDRGGASRCALSVSQMKSFGARSRRLEACRCGGWMWFGTWCAWTLAWRASSDSTLRVRRRASQWTSCWPRSNQGM